MRRLDAVVEVSRRRRLRHTAAMDEDAEEAAAFLAMLRRHGRVLETDDPKAELPSGVTHVLVHEDGKQRLIERRKSAV